MLILILLNQRQINKYFQIMTKFIVCLISLMIFGCDKDSKGLLDKNVYYNYGFKNLSDKAIVIYAYNLSNKLKSYNLKSKEILVTNSIYTKDLGLVDTFFYPYQSDSVVIEFEDKKKLSYSHIAGVKKYPSLMQFDSKYEKIRSRKWSINNTTLKIIDNDDYKLAK